jgi:hypothetical protein
VTTGLRSIGEGERILPAAITQNFVLSSSGALEPMTADSTRPVASTVTHAGIYKVERYSFEFADQDRLQPTIR